MSNDFGHVAYSSHNLTCVWFLYSYRRNEKFTWHLDALAPSDDLESLGGQRTATMLVYLTELTDDDGGATVFRDLKGADGTLRV